jgi:hypothetical protein
MWVDKYESTKEKLATPRTPKALAVKTCPGEARQPDCGKVHAYVLGQSVLKGIYDNDNEQDARDITEHKKPEQKLATAKVAPTWQVLWISPHLAPKKESRGRVEWTRLSGKQL